MASKLSIFSIKYHSVLPLVFWYDFSTAIQNGSKRVAGQGFGQLLRQVESAYFAAIQRGGRLKNFAVRLRFGLD